MYGNKFYVKADNNGEEKLLIECIELSKAMKHFKRLSLTNKYSNIAVYMVNKRYKLGDYAVVSKGEA